MSDLHDTEDRAYWYEHGERKEHEFLTLARQHGLNVRRHPRKERDKTAIDLLLTLPDGREVPADLKTQNTPFFTAGRYGKNPGRAVTLNDKDIRRYERLYPDAVILFHVNWLTLEGHGQRVEPLHGVWLADLPRLRQLIQRPAHQYGRRKTDPRPNASSSHLLSLDNLTCLLDLTARGIPDPVTAEKLLLEAEQMNPGAWVPHSRNVAQAAKLIAERHPDLDPQRMHTLGLLHDIGRRFGPNGGMHVLQGHDYLLGLGYPDAARIALTHSVSLFHGSKGTISLLSSWDGTPEELTRLQTAVNSVTLTEEDQLFQLCDGLALPDGFCTLPERLIDVGFRYGVTEQEPARWQVYFDLKRHFDGVCGVNIYRLLPGLTDRILR